MQRTRKYCRCPFYRHQNNKSFTVTLLVNKEQASEVQHHINGFLKILPIYGKVSHIPVHNHAVHIQSMSLKTNSHCKTCISNTLLQTYCKQSVCSNYSNIYRERKISLPNTSSSPSATLINGAIFFRMEAKIHFKQYSNT